MSYLQLALHSLTVVVSVVTIMWRIFSRQNERNTRALEKINEDIQRIEENYRKEDADLSERINDFERETHKDIASRLARIEGELKGINNITAVMRDWLIANGAKVE